MILLIPFACSQSNISDTAYQNDFDSRPIEDDNTEDLDTAQVEDSNEPVYLTEGTWAFSDITVTEQTCGFPEDSLNQLASDLTLLRYDVERLIEENYVFTLVLEDGTELPNTCTVSDSVYTCDEFVVPIPVRDSTITETYTILGTIDSSVRIIGSLTKNHTCDGPDCDDLAIQNSMVFPCDVTMDFTYNYFD